MPGLVPRPDVSFVGLVWLGVTPDHVTNEPNLIDHTLNKTARLSDIICFIWEEDIIALPVRVNFCTGQM